MTATAAVLVIASALIPAATSVVIVWLALRGSKPGDRPAILRALALCLHRPRRRR